MSAPRLDFVTRRVVSGHIAVARRAWPRTPRARSAEAGEEASPGFGGPPAEVVLAVTDEERRAMRCAGSGCDNPLPTRGRGRPAIYCSPACRGNRGRSARLVVEVCHPESSPDGRAPGRVWTVSLRRGERIVVIAESLGWPSARALARQLEDLLEPGPEQRRVATD